MKLLSNRQSSSVIFLLIFIPVLMLLIHPYASAYRCRDCPDLTPCEAYGGAEAVFIGRAISGEEIKWDDKNSGGKWIQLVGKVRFIVEQSFKGVSGNEVEVVPWFPECEFEPFVKGERYLLYLNRSSNEGLSADICSRSTHISGADEDLKFLSGLTSKTGGARLYGSVGYFGVEYGRDSLGLSSVRRINIGVPGITITVRDNHGRILTAVTNQEGAYEFTGALPDVEYTVSTELPGYLKTEYSWQKERKIGQIGVCGCGRVDFPAIYDSSISGRVTNLGKPVAYGMVAIIRADEKVSGIKALVKFAITDKDGRYLLEGVPPGDYVLGVNITDAPAKPAPYRPTWYPDVATRPEAAIIEVGLGHKLTGRDLIIPRRLAERTIEGTVIWPDGRPAAIAHVHLASSALMHSGRGTGGLNIVPTDKRGRFKITGYEDIAYYVIASSAPKPVEPYSASSMYFYSEPQLVEPKRENVTGLRLTLSWDKGTLRDFFEKKRNQQK
ncbi:MAG TPA: hypothetical protein VG324_17585 [Blastocatellia bacterium]|nr:hypothetical protein [Blastocatellia bacterium]